MEVRRRWLVCAALPLWGAAACCGFSPLERCGAEQAAAGAHLECPVPDWTDRAFDLHIPGTWDGSAELPVVFAFHGGGGKRLSAARVTCADGEAGGPTCLTAAASQAGYVIVFPDGTGTRPLRNIRTWNAGGGRDGYNCTSGPACRQGVDDMAYLDDLLAEVERVVPIDRDRIHAVGLSNGAAISHRWACERPDLLASIAPIGGANQHAETGGACESRVPILQIHGTDDPCWTFETSAKTCLDDESIKVGVAETLEGWRVRNGCDDSTNEEALTDDAPDDGIDGVLVRWRSCDADTQLLRIEGGGHTWPNGWAYLDTERIGEVWRGYDGNRLILEFFDAHPRR